MSNVRAQVPLHLRTVDWKLLAMALLACYVIPTFLIGTLVAAILPESRGVSAALWSASSLLLALLFIAPPVAAGYFTTALVRQRPQLHVLLVATFGFAFVALSQSLSLGLGIAYAAFTIAACTLGAFIRTRTRKNEP